MPEKPTYEDLAQRCIELSSQNEQLRAALKESDARLKSLFEQSVDALYIHDLKGKFLDASLPALRMLGYSPEDLPSLNLYSIIHTEHAHLAGQCMKELMETGIQREPAEFMLKKKDGGFLWVETNASMIYHDDTPVAVQAIARDITERKLVEGILKESEERYRTIFESSGTAKIIADDSSTILLANTGFERLSGYSRSELEKVKSWTDFIMEEDLNRMETYNGMRLDDPASAPKQYEFRFKDRQGQVRDIFLNVDVIPGKKQIVASCLDITDRKRMEDAVRFSEEKYRNILESIQEAFFETDLYGCFTFFNGYACSLLGYSREEMPGMDIRTYSSPEMADMAYDVFHRIYMTGIPERLTDYEVIRKDKDKRVLDISVSLMYGPDGSKVGFRGIARDVTQQRKAERALRQSEERFRGLTELLPQTVYETDESGTLLFINHSAVEQFGYTRRELKKGMQLHQLIAPQDRDLIRKTFQKILGGHRAGLRECTALRKDGSTFSALIHSSAITRNGVPAGIRGFLIDISEKKNLEMQLMRAQKMEAIGTLAGGIAHDFNNLLMGIQGNASLVLLNMEPCDQSYERLKNIEQYVRSGAELTRQLLGFARGGKYQVRHTDMVRFLEKSSEMFARTKKEIRIHRELPHDLWGVEVDMGQMEQVFLNLYVNAWQAMPCGGDLYIRAQNVHLNRKFTSPYGLQPGRYVKVSLADTGVGMDKATMERIFEPFFTTKEMGRGTGLGLASVYGIIKNHSGIITVDSTKGTGSVFTIYLSASSGESGSAEDLPAPRVHPGSETVLIIDDEEMILDVGSEMLKNAGYDVLTAAGGMDGIRIYRENPDLIKLVILDMVMPDMGGEETFDALKKLSPHAKVLLSSGYSLDGKASEIMNKGCRGFIQKPFDITLLSKKIRAILEDKE